MVRCPLCAGLRHTELYGDYLRCTLCSLGFMADGPALAPIDAYRDSRGTHRFPNWSSLRARVLRRLAVLPGRAPYFSLPTVRMFAAREGRRVVHVASNAPLLTVDIPWRFGSRLRARLAPLPETAGPDPRLTLGLIAATAAWPDVLGLWADLCATARDVVVALDTDDAARAAACEAELAAIAPGRHCRVVFHPLQRDFAAQRNRVQDAARTEWVLQLDCDERLTPGTPPILPAIIDDAAREGWVAVALTRRNMVDGVVSALYPDIQYRLLRRSVRFIRAVHEHPDLRPGQASFAHLGAGIIHTLDSERFDRRETFYEGIEPGAARPHDTALLRRPLEPSVGVTQ